MTANAVGYQSIEKLDGVKNYGSWKFQMKLLLIEQGLWNLIDSDQSSVPTQDEIARDQRAYAKICLNVNPACHPHVRNAKTAKEAWDNLKLAYDNQGISRRLALKRKLCRINCNDFESMNLYLSEILSITQDLADLGCAVDDEEIAVIMLCGLPDEYNPLVMTIESSQTKLTSEFVKSRLLQEDYRLKLGSDQNDTALVLKGKQGHAQHKSFRKFIPVCHHCNQKGHIKPRCPKLHKKTPTNTAEKTKMPNDVLLLAAALGSGSFKKEDWVIDSGCTNHMCMNDQLFEDLSNVILDKNVSVANNQTISCIGSGNVKLNLKSNINNAVTTAIINNVLHVPDVATNLLSVGNITDKNRIVMFNQTECRLYDAKTCRIYGDYVSIGSRKNGGLYLLNEAVNEIHMVSDDIVAASSTCISQDTWHRRLGHLSLSGMRMLREHLAEGMNFKDEELKVCIPCIEGKQIRNTFPKGKARRAQIELELIHSDLCGPMSEPSWMGARYFLTFTDDYSRKSFVYLLKEKTQVFNTFVQFKTLVENQTGLKIKRIRTDNGREYCHKTFDNFLSKYGIIHETTIPYTPEQNGVSERLNRTLVEKARTMLKDSGLQKRYWGEAINTAVYLKNRSPTMAVEGATPEEIWSKKKVNLSNLRVFGCEAYVHIPDIRRKKFDSKSKRYIMIGYCEESKGYRLADPDNPGQLKKAKDVIFIENVKNNISNVKSNNQTIEPSISILNQANDNNVEMLNNYDVTLTEGTSDDNKSVEGNGESSEDVDDLNENNFETENIRPVRECRHPVWMKDYEISLTDDDASLAALIALPGEPQTVGEALNSLNSDDWQKAMSEEFDSLKQHNVWELVDRPKNQNIIKSKWVFKIKNENGNERFKARLVARGFSQKYGLDFKETFAPVVRHSTIRFLFALANQNDMDIDHIDIKTAFLNGELTETIYMEQPEAFEIGGASKVCKLRKSIYGLKQASRSWNQKVHKTLTSNQFIQSQCEPCVYIKRIEQKLIIIALYVDDFFVFTNCSVEKGKLIKILNEEFDVKFLGPVTYCLGMKVVRDRQKNILSLNQSDFARRLLKIFGMENAKHVATPMILNEKLKKPENDTCDQKVPYQQLIGGLMYLAVCTRPDLAFAVSYLSQFNKCHDDTHWIAAKRILRYIAGTINYGLVFSKSDKGIEAFADADWANDEVDRKSYTGFVVKVGNCAVFWESRKQKTVALSSTEAEYLALSDVGREIYFIRNLTNEIIGRKPTITVFNDNQSAIKIVSNRQHHKRTKHIEIRHHFLRQAVEDGVIKVQYRPTNNMTADIMTKSLPKDKHNVFLEDLGIKEFCEDI